MVVKHYRTTDLPLTAFLIMKGHPMIAVESRGVQAVFVFEDSESLQKEILGWGNDQPATLKPRSFINQVRDLKGIVGVTKK